MTQTTAKPFVKWAGGKRQLLDVIRTKYPDKIERYCEPFVGGGAVLFDILSQYQPKDVLINDVNPELMNTYQQIRDNVEDLITMLDQLQTEYHSKTTDDSRKKIYLVKRDRFNELKTSNNPAQNLEKAALFIFLNHTCFNGLYRVNSKNLFNVPFGANKSPTICDCENLANVNKALQRIQIQCGDYCACENFIDSNTFVYIDPPYRPLTPTANFVSYSTNIFDDAKQRELGIFIDNIAAKGAKFVASNSDPKNADVNDNFFDILYMAYNIERVSAKRHINSKASGRSAINELLIYN